MAAREKDTALPSLTNFRLPKLHSPVLSALCRPGACGPSCGLQLVRERRLQYGAGWTAPGAPTEELRLAGEEGWQHRLGNEPLPSGNRPSGTQWGPRVPDHRSPAPWPCRVSPQGLNAGWRQQVQSQVEPRHLAVLQRWF